MKSFCITLTILTLQMSKLWPNHSQYFTFSVEVQSSFLMSLQLPTLARYDIPASHLSLGTSWSQQPDAM